MLKKPSAVYRATGAIIGGYHLPFEGCAVRIAAVCRALFRGISVRSLLPLLAFGVMLLAVPAPAFADFTISPSTLPAGTVGVAYSQTLQAGGGASPYSYSITSGALPAGLSLNTVTGALSGTPTAGGTFPFDIAATDDNGQVARISYALVIVSPTIILSPPTLSDATVGVPYSQTITASGGTSSYRYSITSGALPSGLSLNTATGVLSGTPTGGGQSRVTITATDSSTGTGPYSGAGSYTIVVNAPPGAPTNVTATAGNGQAQVNFTPPASDGGSAITQYTVTSSPGGATGTGTVSPIVVPGLNNGTAYTFTVTATNGVGTGPASAASNAVTPATPPTATQAVALVMLTQGVAATVTPVTGAGGVGGLSYSVSPGLPAGLSMSAVTGQISGIPTVTSSTTTYTVTVTDTNGATASANFSLAIGVIPTMTVGLSGSPASVTAGSNITYMIALTVSGATATGVTLSDNLPAGLTFVSVTPPGGWGCTTPAIGANGMISCTTASAAVAVHNFSIIAKVAPGTPVGTITNTATVRAGNATPAAGTATNMVSLQTSSAVVTASLNPSAVGQSVTFTATVTGNAPTGSVTFKDGAATLGTGMLNGGTAIFATSALTAGSHAITAIYGGDAGNAPSTSPVLTQIVNQAATTTVVASSVNPSVPRQPVTFTATVTSTNGTPTGNVNFSDGGVVIGTAALTSGVATFTTAALALGTHSIVASYGGTAAFVASTSTALSQAVNVPADSLKLRQLQVMATTVVAQNSGQAIAGAIDNAISDGFNDGGSLVTPSGTGLRFNFAADPDQAGTTRGETVVSERWNGTFGRDGNAMNGTARYQRSNTSRIDGAFAAIDRSARSAKAPPLTAREPKDWLLWADVRGSGIDRWGSTMGSGQAQLYGSQVNALLGLTRRVTPNFLVGVVGGYETFDYTSQELNGKLTGSGWTVGSYLGWKLASTVRFDAAVAYSGIGYDGSAGTAQGNFNGRRWLLSSGLTGNYKALGFDIQPSARLYALWERENAYTDSLGTQQADRDFATGRASSGVKLSYPLTWAESVMLAPYVGLYGDYYFNHDDAAAIVATGAVPLASSPLLAGWSARATTGLVARLSDGAALALGGELGGIGSDVQIWTFRARANVPF